MDNTSDFLTQTFEELTLTATREPSTDSVIKLTDSYAKHICKLLKKIHPDLDISKKAVKNMDLFIKDVFERIATEAGRLARYNKDHQITSREVQTAVRLVVPGELAKRSVLFATKAMIKYNQDSLD